MKYILDSLGYIEAVSFEAGIEYQGRPGTPYTGKIPANYASLEEWEEKALINAYKIVNGDLVLDEARQKYLENKLAKELEDYTLATHKYVNDKVSLENNLVSDELATTKNGTDFITLENTKDYSIPLVTVESAEDKEVVVSNKNFLSNDLINAGYNGVRLEVKEDKSFTLDGKLSVASEEIPYKSNKESTKMLFIIKAGKDYILSGLNGVTLNLYSYNGTDRELVHSGTGGKIRLAQDKVITYTSLTLKNTETYTNREVKPQLEIGTVATSYVEGMQVHFKSTLKHFINIFRMYEGTTHIMNNKKANMQVKYFLYQTLKNQLASFKVEQDKVVSQVKEIVDFTRNLKGTELEVINALNTTIEELKITLNANTSLVLPSPTLYPSAHLFPRSNIDAFNLCIDTTPSSRPSANIKKYTIDTKVRMLVKGAVKDEVIIKTNGDRTTCTVELIQRLKDVNGVVSELPTPKITKLAEIPLMLLKGNNYVYLEPTGNYMLDLTYIYNTELNKVFTNKTETSTKIEQTKDAINLEVSKKVGKNEIKSAINQSAEAIKIKANNIEFEGTVTANDNFKILPDGSIEAKNGSFSGNILLDDGSTIIGGKGLLTNLSFEGESQNITTSIGNYHYCGINEDYVLGKGGTRFYKAAVVVDIELPKKFTVIQAFLHFNTIPLKVDGNAGDLSNIKNLRLYTGEVAKDVSIEWYLEGNFYPWITSNLQDTGLLNWTSPTTTGKHSVDITSLFTEGKQSIRLQMQSGDALPPHIDTTVNPDAWIQNRYVEAKNSIYLNARVNIIGYLRQ